MEYKVNGFVARDKSGNLYLYEKIPMRDRKEGIWKVKDKFERFWALPNNWFPDQTWQSEPILVETTFNS